MYPKWRRRELLQAACAAGALAAVGDRAAAQRPTRSSDTLGFKPAVELARMIRQKTISSVELTRYFIDRIERFDAAVNAVVVRDFERALAAAGAADEALARREIAGPLHGVPMTVKEAYDVEGLPTTWGFPPLAGTKAARDALLVRRLKTAGAHILGKTNVPVALSDWQSYNDVYGTTNNPWDLKRTPGGSSGGSAAALAAGMTGLESGSDIGGSIRFPAHFCGVYGHKPTFGIVPSLGHAVLGATAEPDLVVMGPLARSAEDLALSLEVIAGPDDLQSPGWRLELPEPRVRALADLRVAVWPTDDLAPVATEVADRVQQIADRLAAAGATVSDTARPRFTLAEAHRTYLTLLTAQAPGNDDAYAANRAAAAGLSADDQSWPAVMLRGGVIDHRGWLYHDESRTRLRRSWKAFLADWDVVLCPVTRTTAFVQDHRPIDQLTLRVDGAETPYLDQLFWAGLATVVGLPNTAFPTGLSGDGLPIGLQAIGAEFSDRTTIEFARLMAAEIGGFEPPPGYED
jgi:amidase